MRFLLVTLTCLMPTLALAQDANRPNNAAVSSLALQDVGPWGAAALPDGMSAISSDLWRGADPGTLSVAFAKLSADQRFPSLQILARQAIFSGGAAPTSDPEVARARFEAANRLGPSDAAARLIFAVPRLTADGGLATIAIDAGLRAGRTEEACGLIEAVPVSAQGVVWLESRATCYALNNEADAANLSVDLAKTRGLTDTWLSRAVAAASGPVSAPPPFRVDSGRAIALSLRAKLKPPLNLVTTNDGAAISSLVRNAAFMDSLAPDERTALVSNGAMRGTLPVELAARPLLAPVVSPADPAVPVTDVPAIPAIPAQLTQRILTAPTLQARAVEARLAVPELRRIMSTQPGLLTLADVPVLTEAALWAGDGTLARAVAGLSPAALDPKLALVVAIYDLSIQPQIAQQILDTAASDPVAKRTALRDVVIGWSAGIPIGGGVSNLIQQGMPWGQPGNSGLRIAIDLAAARGSKGEVALLSALALQGEEPINANPETLVTAVRALKRVGLDSAAKDLARDYLFANYVTLPNTRPAPRPRTTTAAAPTPSSRPAAQPVAQPARPSASTPANRPATTRPPPRPAAAPPPLPAQPRAKPSWGTP